MTEEDAIEYYYIVEWFDYVAHKPAYTVMHKIKLNPRIKPEEFEKFMAEEGFQVGDVSTRTLGVAAQYLLTDATGDPPMRYEELDLSLEPFARRASVTKFQVVASLPNKS